MPRYFQENSPTHFELKPVDATSNPGLALGAVIAVGLDGVRHCFELTDGVSVDPGHLSEAERSSLGIERLPLNLGEAIAHLNQDQIILDALGSQLAQAYLAVRKAEWETMQDFELETEVKLLLERY